jgi:hypothetical protein
MRKKFILLTPLFLSILKMVFAPKALAICPVCTIAVGAGLGLSRWLGIDDTASGVWVGGLILSTSFWLDDWLSKKHIEFKYKKWVVVLAMYLITLVPLRYEEIIGHPFNQIFGIDKLIFGTAIGSGAFLAGMWLDRKVRKIRGNQLFDFQKVVFPVSALLIFSIIMFLVTSVNISFI